MYGAFMVRWSAVGTARAWRTCALGVMVLGAVPATATAAGPPVAQALPVQSPELRTDGQRRVALTATDSTSVSVVDVRTSAVATTPLPTVAAGRPLNWTVLGFAGGRVLLDVRDTTGVTGAPRRYAVLDAAGGAPRVLCAGERNDPIAAGLPLCPSAEGATAFRPTAAGLRWIRLWASHPRRRGSAIRWGLRPDGSFWWRAPTRKEDRKVLSGEHLDLDSTAPRPEEPFGMRVRASFAEASPRVSALAIRRVGDARRSILRLVGRSRADAGRLEVDSAQVGSAGACIADEGRIVLVDRRTRRVWHRAAPAFAKGESYEVACAGRTLVTREGDALDWSLRWPTTADRAGWTSAGILRAGRTLTVGAPAR